MWIIENSGRNDSLTTLLFQTTFTSIDKIISFKLFDDEGKFEPLEVNFTAKNDKNKSNYFIENSGLEDRSLTITYYNPGIGLSGLKDPMIILENDIYYFKIMFNTNIVKDAGTYLLTLEFFIQNK